MAVKSRHQLAKEQALNKKEKREQSLKAQKEYKSLDEVSKLKIKEAQLLSQIKNCEYDLQGPFKNNEVIKAKHDSLVELRNNILIQISNLEKLNNEVKEDVEEKSE